MSAKQWNLKRVLAKNYLKTDDDILVIYANTFETLDTIGYSSIGITIDSNTSFHFSPPFDFNQHGDSLVVTKSAMGSMSEQFTYKNSKPISNPHTVLPNDKDTIEEIKKFLNP